MFLNNLTQVLKKGKIAVLPTDTLYGIHALALKPKSVEKVYQLKKRIPSKPYIILISSVKQLKLFKISVDSKTKKIMDKYWPSKLSIILPCPYKEFEYLHRGHNSLAFRLPNKTSLTNLIDKTGPLISTSVNLEGETASKTIKEAKEIFGDNIDYYLDEGKLDSPPSTLISIEKEKINILRQGEIKINPTHI